MSRNFHHLLNSFTAGILSPKLYGRSDLKQYAQGAKTLDNFISLPYGGLKRRMGTQFIKEVKTSSSTTRLIPFIYSDTISYVLELGNTYIRFYKDKARVESGGSPVEVTTPWSSSEIKDVQYAQIEGVMYFTHPNYAVRKLVRNSATSFTFSTVTFLDGPYYGAKSTAYSGAGSGKTITTSAATGTGLTVTASASLFVSTDVNRFLRLRNATTNTWGYMKITGYTNGTTVTADWIVATNATPSASTQWHLGAFSDTTGFPRAITFYEQRMVLGGTSDQNQTLFFSESANIEDFAPDDASAAATILDTSAIVTTLASAKGNVIQWLVPSRTLFIGTTSQVFNCRASSLEEALTPDNVTVRPEVSIGSSYKQPVVAGSSTLFLGFFNKRFNEMAYDFPSNSFQAEDLLLLSNHLTEQSPIVETAYVEFPDSQVWTCLEDGTLLCLSYLKAQSVAAWSEHNMAGSFSTGGAIVESVASIPGADQHELWMITKRTVNGSTVRYVEVMANEFTDDVEKEDAKYLDSFLKVDNSQAITSVSADSGNLRLGVAAHGWSVGDRVYIKNNLSTFATGSPSSINRIWTIFAVVDANTIDLTGTDITIDTSDTSGTVAILSSSVTGLTHLEGESVTPFVDGAVQPARTVTGGAITLSTAGAKAYVGLNYTSKFESLNLDSASTMGTPQGSIQRIYRTTIQFYRTLGGAIGIDDTEVETIPFREGMDNTDGSPPLFSGQKRLQFPGNWDYNSKIYIEQSQPLPMFITMIINVYTVGDQ